MKIQLASVLVNNPNEAFKFYTEVLGFVKRIHVPEAELAIVASPEEPDGTGLLLEPNSNLNAKTFQEAVYRGCINKLLGRQRVSKVQLLEQVFRSLMRTAAYVHEFSHTQRFGLNRWSLFIQPL
jgi:hypothetical protein